MPGPASMTVNKQTDLLSSLCNPEAIADTLDDQLIPKVERLLGAQAAQLLQKTAELHRAEEAKDVMASRLALVKGCQDRERMLQAQVARMEAAMEEERLRHSLVEHQLQQQLVEERLRAERMRASRDDTVQQRDECQHELAAAYAELEAMQATLADSAVYVRYLRKKVLELEVQNTRNAAVAGQRQAPQDPGHQQGTFSLQAIRTAITAAVKDAFSCSEEERKRRLRALQLRWHPDKNSVLTDIATEVTKIINEATVEAEAALQHKQP